MGLGEFADGLGCGGADYAAKVIGCTHGATAKGGGKASEAMTEKREKKPEPREADDSAEAGMP